ncbi:MAG: hypothetical protein AB1603_00610 [Chloroflexota bacterium]
MKVVGIIFLAAWTVLVLYLSHGAFFRDFARRTYEIGTTYFPTFLIWPKGLRLFSVVYKALVLLFLLSTVAFYVLMLLAILS